MEKEVKDGLKVFFGVFLVILFIILFKAFIQYQKAGAFSMVFLSLFLEAFPFILLGTILSSIVHIFISEETIHKFMPKNIVLGVISVAFLGLIIPVCECAIIPVVFSLYKKKVQIP